MNMPEGRYQNLTHFTRKCETCGKVMKHVGPTRRFCADCTRKRNRVQQGEYRARKAAMAVDKGDEIVEIPKPRPHPNKPAQDNSLGAADGSGKVTQCVSHGFSPSAKQKIEFRFQQHSGEIQSICEL